MDGPPPPPPPHGDNPQNAGGGTHGKRGGLPDGNYDIFIVPPSSAGGGFIYFPSLHTQRNSFIAGCLFTTVLMGVWWVITPVLKEWFSMIIASGGAGVALLLVIVAGAAWGLGRVTLDGTEKPAGGSGTGPGQRANAHGQGSANYNAGGPHPHANGGAKGFPGQQDPPPASDHYYQQSRQSSYNFNASSSSSPPPPQPDASADAKSSWERAREETRKREEEKKKAEELRKKADELRERRRAAEKQKEEERQKEAREREIRERRERLVKEREERLKKEQELKEQEEKEKILREAREKEAKEKAEREAARQERMAKYKADRDAKAREKEAPSPQATPSQSNFRHATAKTEADHETLYSYRPYDKAKSPKKAPTAYTSSQSSFAASSYAASESTARSTPPPSHRNGPYATKDPEKIVIKAVYSFNTASPRLPLASLQSGTPPVSDGLVLRITTEGLFIDDDLRGVPQREWDIKAWTLKTVETGQYRGIHILRASVKDSEGTKYVFIFSNDENWKSDQGVSRLRKSPQIVRALGVSGMGLNEAKTILETTGWV